MDSLSWIQQNEISVGWAKRRRADEVLCHRQVPLHVKDHVCKAVGMFTLFV